MKAGEPTAAPAAPPPDDDLAAQLRGFGPIGILAILVVLSGNFLFMPLSALLVLAWAYRSHTPWVEIGFRRPRSWLWSLVVGVVSGVALKFAMKAIVMPLFGADPINRAYHYLVGNSAAMPGMVFTVIVFAGLGEEMVFRGYLFERLSKLLGRGVRAKALIVVLTSALFASGHYAVQGVPGVQQAIVTGLVFGTIFACTGSLWMIMWMHAAYDVAALWMIYWNLETRIAHWIFK